jgi:hypothetical protein
MYATMNKFIHNHDMKPLLRGVISYHACFTLYLQAVGALREAVLDAAVISCRHAGTGCTDTALLLCKIFVAEEPPQDTPFSSELTDIAHGEDGITFVNMHSSGGGGHRFVVLHIGSLHRVLQSNRPPAYDCDCASSFTLQQFLSDDDVIRYMPLELRDWITTAQLRKWWHDVCEVLVLTRLQQHERFSKLFGIEFHVDGCDVVYL